MAKRACTRSCLLFVKLATSRAGMPRPPGHSLSPPLCFVSAVFLVVGCLLCLQDTWRASPGGLAAQRRWFFALTAACQIDLGVWKAPRGAVERDLLGICGGIGRFNDHQTIAATPHRSPVLWDMFAHRFPALVS